MVWVGDLQVESRELRKSIKYFRRTMLVTQALVSESARGVPWQASLHSQRTNSKHERQTDAFLDAKAESFEFGYGQDENDEIFDDTEARSNKAHGVQVDTF